MIEAALADLRSRNLTARIWYGDHTVWKPEPTEIADRLGWLTITDRMRDGIASLEAFAAEVKDEGFRHVVLLGMGGSSLGPEVIGQTFGSAAGYPKLIVLDSTIPDSVQAVNDEIDPVRTLFVVSSKSGTTIEPLAFYNHFRSLVDAKVAERVVGQRFAAITDPGTPLERVAELDRFRRVFLNASDIGGRYSILSYFGMVPAVLAGVDIAKLLERADGMKDSCAPYVDVNDNPGARLGAVMASHATQGRDKLSLVLSPSITGFGLWVEQLIAESTGKEGRGIVPVVGEPLVGPSCYGDDRLFVYLRLDGDNNGDLDAAMADLESVGQPVVRLELGDKYDLGAEFFRWQFATAVAGSVLGIHPFDQPDVQQAKDETARGLREYRESGRLPQPEESGSIEELLSQAKPGDYLAILAYVRETQETNEALTELRRRVMERYHIATTVGYGPRFLHSTGQIHKGGPNSGLFLQISAERQDDIPVPREPYTFGVLADAQALGDMRALQAQGRRVAGVRLKGQHGEQIRRIAERA